jgi:hypothetical protein
VIFSLAKFLKTQFWCQLYYRPNDGFNWTSPALFQNRSAEMDAILTDPPFVSYLNRTSPELAKRIVTNIRSMHLTPEQLLVLGWNNKNKDV